MTDALAHLGSVLGLGFLSGFRLYATVAVLGLAVRFNLLHLSQEMSNLAVVADWRVIAVAGALAVVEFLADKVPWLDSAWDSIHTVVRPVAAGLLAVTALGETDGALKVVLGLVAGGVALTAHSAKAATRLAVNHSPEPFSNIALSVAEDIAAPVGLWIVMKYPLAAAGIVGAILLAIVFVAPRVYRLMRMEFAALGGLCSSWFGDREEPNAAAIDRTGWSEHTQHLWGLIEPSMETVPDDLAAAVRERAGVAPHYGVQCAATATVPGLKRSVGYLTIAGGKVAFVARRGFRTRVYEVELESLRGSTLRNGLFVNELTLATPSGPVRFDVFKRPVALPARAGHAVAGL